MKKLFTSLVFALLIFSLAVPGISKAANDTSFKDISGTYWAKDAIDSLVQLGVITGYEDHTFKPNESVTREEFASLITKSFYLDLPSKNAPQTFADVATNRWSFPAIEASKEFLTGYYPPSGKSFFDPKGKATREDVAVALVKAMHYETDDLQDQDILTRFRDADAISPNVRQYIALAVEKKLITGYEDYTFKPAKAVTRAEAASLLYRVIKGAAGDSQQTLALNVSAPATTSSPTFYITGDVTKGAQVFINNKEVEVVQGNFRVGFQLDEEGTYTYTVSARLSGGKTQQVTKTVKFEKGAPTLEVTGVPENTDKQTITVSWKVKDDNDSRPDVFVNGERFSYESSTTITLQEGENTITVKAVNSIGKSTEVTKKVTLNSGAPKLTVDPLPTTTDKDSVTVSWRVQDNNDSSPKVYVNEELISYSSSTTVKLTSGANVITVRAVNKQGKTTEVTNTVNFVSGGPTLKVNPVPASTTKKEINVSWSVSDKNDSSPKMYVNGDSISYSTSTNISLKPGLNTISFKAVNNLGQTTEESRTITFDPPAPTITLGYAPTTTQQSSLTLTWTASDENDYPKVYINDELISYGSSSTLSLKPGDNTFKIVASNSYGKTTTITYNVTYTPAP